MSPGIRPAAQRRERMTDAAAPHVSVPIPAVSDLAAGCSVLLATLQLFGGHAGEAAAAAGVIAALAIGWFANHRYLPAALILCFPALGISGASFPDAVQFAAFAGVGLPAPLGLMVGAGMRSLAEFVRPGPSVRRWPSRVAGVLFGLALLVAALGALQGRSMGLNAWSEGVRSVLAVGGLFWGFMIVRGAGASAVADLPRTLVRITVAGALLYAVTLMRGHLLFVLMGLSAGLLAYFARERRVVAFLLTAAVAGAGLVMYSLTTAAIVLLTIGCLLLARLPAGVLRRFVVRTAVLATALLSAAVILAVLRHGERLALELTVHAARSEGIVQFALFKLMSDRGSLWLAAVQQIISGPHVIVPAGRPLYPLLGAHAGLEWLSGPHNSILQLLRNTGVVAAASVLILVLTALVRTGRILASTRNSLTRCFAASFIGVAISGMTTGDFPVSDVGFFLWSLAGMVTALHAYEDRTPAGEIRSDQSNSHPALPPAERR
jgi:hypothetical protein